VDETTAQIEALIRGEREQLMGRSKRQQKVDAAAWYRVAIEKLK
jgi:hypothetical protein